METHEKGDLSAGFCASVPRAGTSAAWKTPVSPTTILSVAVTTGKSGTSATSAGVSRKPNEKALTVRLPVR